MNKDAPPEYPTEPTNIAFKINEKGTRHLEEKANAADCSTERVIKEGIDLIFKKANEDAEAALNYVTGPNSYRPTEDSQVRFEIETGPKRKAYFNESIRRMNEKTDDRSGEVTEKPAMQAAVKAALTEVPPSEISEEDELKKKTGFQHYDKLPGRDRGGVQLRFDITEKAKSKLDKKAEKRSWRTSRVARTCMRKMLDWIEDDAEEAFEYIRQDSDFYQPPNSKEGYRYSYQFYAGILDKMRLKRARWIIQNGPGKNLNRRITQREIMQAAARFGIEDYKQDLGIVTA